MVSVYTTRVTARVTRIFARGGLIGGLLRVRIAFQRLGSVQGCRPRPCGTACLRRAFLGSGVRDSWAPGVPSCRHGQAERRQEERRGITPRYSGRSGAAFAAVLLAAVMLVLVPAWSEEARASGRADDVPVAAVDSGASEEPVVIEADSTEYHYGAEGTIIEARGNVHASQGDLIVSCDYVRVDVGAGALLARGNVVIRRGSSVTRCSLFSYDMKAAAGRVLDPDGSVPGVNVRGKEMDVAPDRLTLSDAYATGCDLEDPCYRVTTKRLVIYPDQRVVAEWPVLWLEHVPVLVLPRLTIPLRGERVGWVEGEGYPVPRLGYDAENGFVAGVSYLDRSREDLTIRYDAAYVTRPGGLQLEARADASLWPGAGASVTAGLRSWEGPYGSFRCSLDLTGPTAQADESAISVAADASYRSGTAYDAGLQGGVTAAAKLGPLALNAVARKDLPSTGAVYALPAVDATLSPFGGPAMRVTLSGGIGRFEEPAGGIESTRSYAAVSVSSGPLKLVSGAGVSLTAGLGASIRRAWYGTGDGLASLTATARLDGSFGRLEAFGAESPRVVAGLEYTRRAVSGASPFAFDAVSALNQVTADVTVRVNESWSLGTRATYDIDGNAVNNVDLSLTNHHHCYDISATWDGALARFGLEIQFKR